MQVAFQLREIEKNRNSVVTVGSFDGVHRAHQEIIRQVVARAQARRGRSAVVTFEPHPSEVVRGKMGPVQLLTSPEERQRLVEPFGVDLFFVIPFDYDFSRQSSREFYVKYLVEGIGVSEVVEGYDHHFGRDREGSVEDLVKLGKEFEFSITAVKPVYAGDVAVNSSRIRQHLLEGNVEQAMVLLGRPYMLDGTVVRGDARGRELGYPTANMRLKSARKLVPKNGIYFVQVGSLGSEKFGMASVGVRPTFYADGVRVVEVNILDFSDDIYGQDIDIHFLKRLRDELRFESAEALIQQMHKDKESSRQLQREFQQSSR